MKELREVEKQLKALANGRRIIIVRYISRKGEASVGDIADEIKLSFKATSAHLLILFAAGLLDRRQTSTTVLYKLSQPTPPLIKTMLSIL